VIADESSPKQADLPPATGDGTILQTPARYSRQAEPMPFQPPVYLSRATPPPRPVYAPPPPPPAPARSPLLSLAGGAMVMLCLLSLCGGVAYVFRDKWLPGTGGLSVLPSSPSQPVAGGQSSAAASNPDDYANITPLTFSPQATTLAGAGATVKDERGVALVVPGDVISPEQKVQLVASQGSGGLGDMISQAVKVESPYYSVAVQGKLDGRGEAELSFPAPSAASRLAVISDGSFASMLSITPENGQLKVKAHLGPAEISPMAGRSYTNTGDIRYVVVTPKEGAVLPDKRPAAMLGSLSTGLGLLNPLLSPPHEATTCTRCDLDPNKYRTGISTCRINNAGTVFVNVPLWDTMFYSEVKITEPEIDHLVLMVTDYMAQYAKLGFPMANLSSADPIEIIIKKNVSADDAPEYSTKTGIIYIPANVATNPDTAENRYAIRHELFHWIEGKKYSMFYASLFGDTSWWQDIAAETGVFLAEPKMLEASLKKYGPVADKEYYLGFQKVAWDWDRYEEARYIQAQMLYVNMCDNINICEIRRWDFFDCINNGNYPFESRRGIGEEGKRDYARYLLGFPPEITNTKIWMSPILQTGIGYGDFIHAQTLPGNPGIEWKKSNYPPHMAPNPEKTRVDIDTTIDWLGVYPLRVSNGGLMPSGDSQSQTLPAPPLVLTIEPGFTKYYRLGDGEFKESKQGEPFVIQPIHNTLGIPYARVIGINKSKDEKTPFKAKVEMVDLSGDLVITATKMLANDVKCDPPSKPGNSTIFDGPDIIKVVPGVTSMMALSGSYLAHADRRQLEWQVSGDYRQKLADAGADFVSLMDINGKEIKVNLKMTIKEKATSRFLPDLIRPAGLVAAVEPLPPPGQTKMPLATLWLLPLGGVAIFACRESKKRNVGRLIVVTLLLSLVVLALQGCLKMSGTIDTDMTFGKLEYVGLADQPEKPLWRLSKGVGLSNVDMTVTSENPLDKNAPPEVQRCTGQVKYELSGEIFKEGVIKEQKK
jgi:hypothetical protein